MNSIKWCMEQRNCLNLPPSHQFVNCLSSHDEDLVIVAIDTLAKFGKNASAYYPVLVLILEDEKRSVAVRDTAAYCLGCIGIKSTLPTWPNFLPVSSLITVFLTTSFALTLVSTIKSPNTILLLTNLFLTFL